MRARAAIGIGHHDLYAMPLHPLLIPAVLHRVARGEQQRFAAAGRFQPICGLIDDMDEGHVDDGLHGLGHEMHGHGADHHAIGPGPFKAARDICKVLASGVPACRFLHVDDPLEVDGIEDDLRRMQPAPSFAHGLVDLPIVDGGAFKAHAAK